MNADSVVRALAKVGQDVKIQRLTGTQRVPFEVPARVHVAVGAAELLVGNVQQTVDVVTMTNRELKAMQWPGSPRHGDQIKFKDGHTAVIQGRPQIYNIDNTGDLIYVMHTIGG